MGSTVPVVLLNIGLECEKQFLERWNAAAGSIRTVDDVWRSIELCQLRLQVISVDDDSLIFAFFVFESSIRPSLLPLCLSPEMN